MTLSPTEILTAMIGELGRMRKVVEEADVLRPRVKRAERFIRQFATTWNLPLPDGTVPVRTNPRPEGIEIQDGYPCNQCSRSFGSKQALGVHRARGH